MIYLHTESNYNFYNKIKYMIILFDLLYILILYLLFYYLL